MKKAYLLMLSLLLALGVAGCALITQPSAPPVDDEEVEAAPPIDVADVIIDDEEFVAEEIEELTTVENVEPIEQQDDLSDEELAELAVHFSQFDVNPDVWWILGQNIDVDMEVEPFGEEGFRPVGRFNSIAEMQEATEQIVSRRYAEEHLYRLLDGPHRMFLERDGRLYRNTSGEGAWRIPMALEGHIISRSENEAIVAVTYDPFLPDHMLPEGESVFNIRMVRESGGWRYDGVVGMTA